MEAKLVVVGGDSKARQFELHLPMVIGRSRGTDLRLRHPLVSREHCEVFEANGILMVRDLGSLNGTFVGDTRIVEQAIPVKPGDLLTIGPVTFRAEYHTALPMPEDSKLSSSKSNGAAPWDSQGLTADAPLAENGEEIKDLPSRRFSPPPDDASSDDAPSDDAPLDE